VLRKTVVTVKTKATVGERKGQAEKQLGIEHRVKKAKLYL
jgi:hypothetical protein